MNLLLLCVQLNDMALGLPGREEREAYFHQVIAAVAFPVRFAGRALAWHQVDLFHLVIGIGIQALQFHGDQLLAITGMDVKSEYHSLLLLLIHIHHRSVVAGVGG